MQTARNFKISATTVRLTRTFTLLVESFGVSGFASSLLFLLLTLAALVEVFDDDADEHVEYEEADEQQERDEVEKAPFVVVCSRLHQQTTCVTHANRTQTHQTVNMYNPQVLLHFRLI